MDLNHDHSPSPGLAGQALDRTVAPPPTATRTIMVTTITVITNTPSNGPRWSVSSS
jgi:hypothetical protein